MMARDERRKVLSELRLRTDLTEVPVDQLAAAIQEAREQRDGLQEFVGKAIAAMHNREGGLKFTEIAELTGLPHSTLHYWAKPYL